ncbi:hypothetical protein VL14_16145 [Cytobacillus firmus]|nr:hypothetical protein VL14_16145 [Cytobacillus firmus]
MALWTEIEETGEFESEPFSTSDRESRNPVGRVRTRLNFRQRKPKSCWQSPNPAQLRTEKAEILLAESEPGPTSDSESRNRASRVRTRLNFGQRKPKPCIQSPNPFPL